MNAVTVYAYADDPVVERGISSSLRGQPGVRVLDGGGIEDAEVVVVATDQVDADVSRVVRAMQRNGCRRVVMVVASIDEAGLLMAVEAGACGVLRRRDASPESMVRAIRAAAAGDGTLPPDLLGTLLTAVGRLRDNILEPRGLSLATLTDREIAVLRLVADGYDTSDIAEQLAYSPRTIKNVIHDITVRLQLRNRTHAVAYALRQGLI